LLVYSEKLPNTWMMLPSHLRFPELRVERAPHSPGGHAGN
jgi:hypothetical protein